MEIQPAMLFEQIITYKFKGNRDYVPGVDIFESVLEMTRQYFGGYPDSVKGGFHQFLRTHAVVRIHPGTEILDTKTCCAHFLIEYSGVTYQVIVFGSETLISESYEYDEDLVTGRIKWSENTANFLVQPGYSYMEQMVAITKKLHIKQYPEAVGQWIFTKIQVNGTIDPNAFINRNLELRAGKNFHNKLTQNFIYLDDEFIGEIWFSLLPEGEAN